MLQSMVSQRLRQNLVTEPRNMKRTVQYLSWEWSVHLQQIAFKLGLVTYISQENMTGFDQTEALNVLVKLGFSLLLRWPLTFQPVLLDEDLESIPETSGDLEHITQLSSAQTRVMIADLQTEEP